MSDYHKAIYEAEEFMGGPATLPKSNTCPKCGQQVDDDGASTGGCPINPTEQCEECLGCFCDGSC